MLLNISSLSDFCEIPLYLCLLFSQISELLAALAMRRSPSFDPRNISTSLSTLTNTGAGPFKTNGTFRSRATLPENIRQLSRRQFMRRDFLKESLPIPLAAPISTAVASSQEEHLQPSLPSSTCVFPAHLADKRLPSDSVGSIGERLEEREMHPHILGVQARTRRTQPEQNPQSGPTSAWFFEDLTDLQRKLFSVCSSGGQGPPVLVDAWLVPTFFSLIMLVGLVGNSLVIHVVTKHQQMKTVTNFYIVNLATSDILFLSLCADMVNYLQQVTAQATCITLSAMSVDRCYVTVYPLQSLQHRTPRMALAISVSIWIGSLLLSIPVAVYQRLEAGYWFGPQTYCSEVFPSASLQRAFIIYSFLRMGQASVNPIDSSYQLQAHAERAAAVRARISRMVVVMVALFLICWGPIQVCILLQAFGLRSYLLYKLKIWGHCMSYSNSSVNPLVYRLHGQQLQEGLQARLPRRISVAHKGESQGGKHGHRGRGRHGPPGTQRSRAELSFICVLKVTLCPHCLFIVCSGGESTLDVHWSS
ncbi:hypothetical protein KUCAC02_028244 [Chaenocephalus aceratus]|uniref:Uncharacterized protein n=1 Tax=Chaenocephalus aceratus TaxID=36190 RepID=A0ACB9X1A3_CHAAC|nr:hypothetical protein KUCAC02_028244 [Chaenocephalus aceratus]